MRRMLAAVVTALLFAGAAPATADETYVDLRVQVFFDHPAYLPTDVVRMSVNIHNQGTAAATGVVMRSTGDMSFTGWGRFDETGPGVYMPPGYSTVIEVFATPNDPGNGMTQQVEAVSAEPEHNPADNVDTATAFVTSEVCDLTLTLHADADGDGVLEPGETKSGVLVKLNGGLAHETVEARTDAQGVARFPKITGGEYSLKAGLPADWYVDVDEHVQLREGHNEVVVRAWHVDLSKVTATVSLDRDTYQVGDPVRERVTVTNNGTVDIHGLIAMCGSIHIEGSGENELTSSGWAELEPGSLDAGATVRAGETRVWEFTAEITPRMWDYGSVVLKCDFRVEGMREGLVTMDRATVPGARGTFGGQAYLTENHTPLPGLQILMIEVETGKVATRTVAGEEGYFELPEVAAGEYQLRPLGPWRTVDKTATVQVLAGVRGEVGLEIEPGPMTDDPENPATPKTPVNPVPTPQASPAPHPSTLAHTGFDGAGLLALGLLLLVAGAWLVRIRRA